MTAPHLLPTSCHVCGAVAADTGRPACGHDLTNAEADAAAAAHDARSTFTYSTGQRTVEGQYVATVRPA